MRFDWNRAERVTCIRATAHSNWKMTKQVRLSNVSSWCRTHGALSNTSAHGMIRTHVGPPTTRSRRRGQISTKANSLSTLRRSSSTSSTSWSSTFVAILRCRSIIGGMTITHGQVHIHDHLYAESVRRWRCLWSEDVSLRMLNQQDNGTNPCETSEQGGTTAWCDSRRKVFIWLDRFLAPTCRTASWWIRSFHLVCVATA